MNVFARDGGVGCLEEVLKWIPTDFRQYNFVTYDELMYQSIQNFNIPHPLGNPPGIWHFDFEVLVGQIPSPKEVFNALP
jgi:hypothetical protein